MSTTMAKQQLTSEQEELVARIRATTDRVRLAEDALERVRLERRSAMKAAHDGGVTMYRVAQEAGTSNAGAVRIVHDFDEKWRAHFDALDAERDQA